MFISKDFSKDSLSCFTNSIQSYMYSKTKMTTLDKLSHVELLNFSSGVEKNNDTAHSIVLRKSNNWDSPAEVIRENIECYP